MWQYPAGRYFLYEDGDGMQHLLVLQENVLNEGLPTVVCAPIEPYSPRQEFFANEVVFLNKETDLGVDGICLLHKVTVIDRRGLVEKKGEISMKRLQDVYQALDITLGRFRDGEFEKKFFDL